jgi:hypothetical protein
MKLIPNAPVACIKNLNVLDHARKDRRITKGYSRSDKAATGRDRPPLRDYIREDGLPGGRFPTPNGGA